MSSRRPRRRRSRSSSRSIPPSVGSPRLRIRASRFDPGAIGVNGLIEKDVDLDVGNRLAALLRADLVDVVLTRGTDVYVSAARREQIVAGASLGCWSSVSRQRLLRTRNTRGSLVLYPSTSSSSVRANRERRTCRPGHLRRCAEWRNRISAIPPGSSHGCPAPPSRWDISAIRTDATLMATTSFRQDVAAGVRNGVEAYMPSIIARRNAIRAWRSDHPAAVAPGAFAPASATLPGTSGFQFAPVIAWLLAIVAVGLRAPVPRRRRARPRCADRDSRASVQRCDVAAACCHPEASTAAARRWSRRSRPVSTDRRRGSVYDDIPL